MEFIQKKEKIKDYLILSLIDTVIELYSYNYDIDKDKVKCNLLSKLEEMDILDIDINQSNIIPIKKQIINVLKDEIPKKSIDNTKNNDLCNDVHGHGASKQNREELQSMLEELSRPWHIIQNYNQP